MQDLLVFDKWMKLKAISPVNLNFLFPRIVGERLGGVNGSIVVISWPRNVPLTHPFSIRPSDKIVVGFVVICGNSSVKKCQRLIADVRM